MKVGDLVRFKPSLFNSLGERSSGQKPVHLVQEVFYHRAVLWVKIYDHKQPYEADLFEVINESG